MGTDKKKIFLNTLFWGCVLWLFGYILGIIFFAIVPREYIGWFILPLVAIATLWVLYKKIERDSFKCYIALGVFWAIIAIVLDYIFIVVLLKSSGYYKPDVYFYYLLTLALPILIGWQKVGKTKIETKNNEMQ